MTSEKFFGHAIWPFVCLHTMTFCLDMCKFCLLPTFRVRLPFPPLRFCSQNNWKGRTKFMLVSMLWNWLWWNVCMFANPGVPMFTCIRVWERVCLSFELFLFIFRVLQLCSWYQFDSFNSRQGFSHWRSSVGWDTFLPIWSCARAWLRFLLELIT